MLTQKEIKNFCYQREMELFNQKLLKSVKMDVQYSLLDLLDGSLETLGYVKVNGKVSVKLI